MGWYSLLNDLLTSITSNNFITAEIAWSAFYAICTLTAFYFLYKLAVFSYRRFKEHQYHQKLSKSGIKDIDRMDGLQFEIYLKALLKELGYKVLVTKNTQDFGADLIIKKDNKKISVQAKRYGYKNKVSVDAVQQAYASMPYYKTNESWIITNSYLTKNANKLANTCKVNVYDRPRLVNWIKEINPNVTAKQIIENVEPKPRKCPVCNEYLIVRTNKNKQSFFGCTNYPTCEHTESINK